MARARSRELDQLFELPPNVFTAARKALMKELRAGGGPVEEAEALRRPTWSLWTVNQLARREEPAVARLVEAGERLGRVHRGLVTGKASADDLRAASRAYLDALGDLERRAAARLEGAGAKASPEALRRVRSTLQAASIGPEELRERLVRGVLTEELAPPELTALPWPEVPAAKRTKNEAQRRERKRAAGDEERRRAAEERRVARSRVRAETLERRAHELEGQVARLRDAARALRGGRGR